MSKIAIAKTPEAFEKWSLEEITICDVPAQEPAAAVIMKAMKAAEAEAEDDEDEEEEDGKPDFLKALETLKTDPVNAEAVQLITSRAAALGLGKWIPSEGELALSKSGAEGAHDKVPELKEGHMPNPNPKGATPSDAETKIADLEKRLEAATAMAALTDVEKAYMGGLDKDGQEQFLKADAASRKADVDKAQELAKAKDPVVFTSEDGTEFRKSDDPRLVQMAKDRDHDRAIAKAERAAREGMELEKRATAELDHLPGETVAKVALLRAVGTIEDPEIRKAVETSLKAQNAEMAKAFSRVGSTGEGKSNPEVELDKLATDVAKAKGIPFEKAYSEVIDSPEGRKLYAEHEAERMSRAPATAR